MNAMIGLLVPALLGVDFGWQRMSDGAIEYVVQVDPDTFAEMQRDGVEIGSAVPAGLRDRVRSFTFRVGRDPLPNQNTLPVEAQAPQLDASAADGPKKHTANFQPPGSPGGSGSWGGEQPTTVRWPAAPTTIPAASFPAAENPRYAGAPTSSSIPTPVPTTASSSTSNQPLSTGGFPMNNTTMPASGSTSGSTFPGSTLGTLPSSNPPTSTMPSSAFPPNPFPSSSSVGSATTNSTNAAWPTTTAPPSLGTGPRNTQPQPFGALPRETTISARMPAEPNLPTPGLGAAPGYNYPAHPTPSYQPPQYQTPPPGWNQNPQVAQAGYSPNPGTSAGPQFPTGTLPNGQPMYGPNGQPLVAPGTNYVATQPKEPPSASDKTQAAKPADSLWIVLTWIMLCTSFACNLYFGWSKYQMQERYRLLLVDRGAYSS